MISRLFADYNYEPQIINGRINASMSGTESCQKTPFNRMTDSVVLEIISAVDIVVIHYVSVFFSATSRFGLVWFV